jgi:hypothetical protein
MERLGVTKRDLGVVPHGLRHQYAAERYEKLTGDAPPVAGGSRIEKTLDEQTRLIVAKELGHGRMQITNAYLGNAAKAKATDGNSEPTSLPEVRSAARVTQLPM